MHAANSFLLTWEQFFNVFIPFIGGAATTIIGQIFITGYQAGFKEKRECNRFITILKDSLKNTNTIFSQIISAYEKDQSIDKDQINKFRNSRKIYEKYIENIVLIEPHSFRTRISDYFLESEALIDRLEQTQTNASLMREQVIKLEGETSSLGGINHDNITHNERNAKIIDLMSIKSMVTHFDKVLNVYIEHTKTSKNIAEALLAELEKYRL